jgi:uncharacterized phage-like protein YoqJ
MTTAVTGHRPDKLGGYNMQTYRKLWRFALHWYESHDTDKLYIGMAQGWDTAVAVAARKLQIPYIACIPFIGYDRVWRIHDQKLNRELIEAAEDMIVISHEASKQAYHDRNRFMVDSADRLDALWNGVLGVPSGTGSTVFYAEKKQIPVVNLWQEWKDFQ